MVVEYTQCVSGNEVLILKDGVPLTVEELVEMLNGYEKVFFVLSADTVMKLAKNIWTHIIETKMGN